MRSRRRRHHRVLRLIVVALLPRERNFVRAPRLRFAAADVRASAQPAPARDLRRRLRDMFNFLAAFTYLGFRLAAPPFDLSTAAIGAVFVAYLISLVTAPYTGRLVSLFRAGANSD